MRLIDVDALIDDVVDRYCKDCKRRKGIKRGEYRIIYEIGEAPCRACGVGDMLDELENAPTVNVPDKNVGKWIDAWRSALDGTRHWYRECSECGYERDDDNIDKDTKFCPNCGAYMGVEDVQESD